MSGHTFPAHASPALPPMQSPQTRPATHSLSEWGLSSTEPPSSLLSPATTPPATPGGGARPIHAEPASVPVDSSTFTAPPPKLLDTLPHVKCEVRARIPTTTGQQMFLYLYQNDVDNKEHLAIVFGDHIRSRSLDEAKDGETERDRLIRGAYTGTLHPGRTSSRVQQLKLEHGVKSSPILSSTNTTEGHGSERSVENGKESSDTEASGGNGQASMVRIHSECYTGETVWSARCDCGEQLDEAQRLMCLPSNHAGGVIVYLRQEGRGIGLKEKLKAYNLQDLGHDTFEANVLLRHPADARSYGIATAILLDLGLGGENGIRLLTNNPDKIRAVEGPNREVTVKERVPMIPLAWQTGGQKGVKSEEVEKYLSTKIEKFSHMLSR